MGKVMLQCRSTLLYTEAILCNIKHFFFSSLSPYFLSFSLSHSQTHTTDLTFYKQPESGAQPTTTSHMARAEHKSSRKVRPNVSFAEKSAMLMGNNSTLSPLAADPCGASGLRVPRRFVGATTAVTYKHWLYPLTPTLLKSTLLAEPGGGGGLTEEASEGGLGLAGSQNCCVVVVITTK